MWTEKMAFRPSISPTRGYNIMNPATNLIKHFEACKPTMYQCPAGIDTIGYGHTGPDVHPGMVITQEQADALLDADLEKFCAGVDAAVKVPLNVNQRATLHRLRL
jgi:lysozyme